MKPHGGSDFGGALQAHIDQTAGMGGFEVGEPLFECAVLCGHGGVSEAGGVKQAGIRQPENPVRGFQAAFGV